MNKRKIEGAFLVVLTVVLSGALIAQASLTFTGTAITGDAASTIDVGTGTLSIQTTNNGAITAGTGAFTIPALLKEDSLNKDWIVYAAVKDLKLQGINLKLDLNIWKILFSTNMSYYFSSDDRHNYNLPRFTSYGGVYYVDTLFNNNLHLRAGLNYFLTGERDFTSIDFEKSIFTNFFYDPIAQKVSLISLSPVSTSFQIDFFLAGKIQNSATVYFVFENLFNTKYFIVPYYPKQARGIRFGVAWEFLD